MIFKGWIAKDFEGTVWFSRKKPSPERDGMWIRWRHLTHDVEDVFCLGKRTGLKVKPNTCRRVHLELKERVLEDD
jgi:hypothetical protein